MQYSIIQAVSLNNNSPNFLVCLFVYLFGMLNLASIPIVHPLIGGREAAYFCPTDM